jgi:hypothetical protein
MATADANINWGNLDDEEDFKNLSQKVQDAHSRNFVVEFDSKEANCAFDLREEGIKSLLEQRLQSQNHEPFKTRWINIWMPDKQPDVINHIAHHYGFSPRLKSSMRCQHHKPVPIPSQPQHRTAREVMHGVPGRSKHYDATKLADLHNDPEDQGSSPLATAKATTFDVNHYRIVSEVWHFASIDWGYKFTCIGYNSLYRSARNLTDPKQAKSEKPAGKRVWTWLVLCNDHTLISIHENPFPFEEVPPSQYTLSIRNNLVNVFKQLSKSSVHESHNPIMTVNIRQGLHGHEGDESQVSEDSGPSLLFYYLFDDWYTSYALVARYDHQYGKYLENIRDDMFVSPNLESARHLHHFGRQLAVLKRIYESYTMIIDRLLKGPQASFRGAPVIDDLRRFGHVATGAPTSSTNAVRGTGFAYGVPVSTAAAVRFERLRDRISLYALSEIDDCLAEKEALVMLVSTSQSW